MPIDASRHLNWRIAAEFLRWNPPIDINEVALFKDNDSRFADAHADDLAVHWLRGTELFSLPDFIHNEKAAKLLLEHFVQLGFFFEIEAFGPDYITTIYEDKICEKIVASGRHSTKAKSICLAAINYLDFYFPFKNRKFL